MRSTAFDTTIGAFRRAMRLMRHRRYCRHYMNAVSRRCHQILLPAAAQILPSTAGRLFAHYARWQMFAAANEERPRDDAGADMSSYAALLLTLFDAEHKSTRYSFTTLRDTPYVSPC